MKKQLCFLLVLIAACGAPSAVPLEGPVVRDPSPIAQSARENLRIPIRFHQLTAPELPPPREPVTQASVEALLKTANQIWSQCDIEFTDPTLTTTAVPSLAALLATQADIDAKRNELLARLGKAPGPSIALEYLARILIVADKVSTAVFGKPPSGLEPAVIPVVMVSDARRLDPTFSRALAHAEVTLGGLGDFLVHHGDPQLKQTYFITYGENPADWPERGSSVLAHELGHMLGLNHDDPIHVRSLMTQTNNDILPRQCEVARAFLERRLGRDVFGADGRACRATVAERTCRETRSGGSVTRTCGVASTYVEPVLELYDELPQPLKRELCALDSIRIVEGQRHAGETQQGDKPGAYSLALAPWVMAISPFVRHAEFAAWKEQLSFGGTPEPSLPLDSLPRYRGAMLQGSPGPLYTVAVHELGHVLELRLNLGSEWSALSWNPASPPWAPEPTTENDFPHRAEACFYFCQGAFLSNAVTKDYYAGLFNTQFVSGYAAVDASEDFAETFVYYVLDNFKGASLALILTDGTQYDAMAHYRSDRLAAKRAFMKSLFDAQLR